MIIEVNSIDETMALGEKLGRILRGGDAIEMIGDVGAGKTTFTKGLARGLGVEDDVQSPTFTISRVYQARDGLQLAHYDFYRLVDAGIMSEELRETIHEPHMITCIEWGEIVAGVVPKDSLRITLESPTETSRRIEFTSGGEQSQRLVEALS